MKAYVYGANGPEITDVAKPTPKGTRCWSGSTPAASTVPTSA